MGDPHGDLTPSKPVAGGSLPQVPFKSGAPPSPRQTVRQTVSRQSPAKHPRPPPTVAHTHAGTSASDRNFVSDRLVLLAEVRAERARRLRVHARQRLPSRVAAPPARQPRSVADRNRSGSPGSPAAAPLAPKADNSRPRARPATSQAFAKALKTYGWIDSRVFASSGSSRSIASKCCCNASRFTVRKSASAEKSADPQERARRLQHDSDGHRSLKALARAAQLPAAPRRGSPADPPQIPSSPGRRATASLTSAPAPAIKIACNCRRRTCGWASSARMPTWPRLGFPLLLRVQVEDPEAGVDAEQPERDAPAPRPPPTTDA